MVKVEQVKSVPIASLLEGPHWVGKSNSLYFCAILDSTIFRYDYIQDRCYKANVEGEVGSKIGFILPVEDKPDQFVIGLERKLVLIEWNGVSASARVVKVLAEVDEDVKTTRFNDGKVDPSGRIFAGTMLSEENGDIFTARVGSFFRFDSNTEQCINLKSKLNISNGLAWDEKKNRFYFVDTGDKDIKEFDYDPSTGNISNERVVISFAPCTFGPDGMTIDAEGNLYLATFGAGKILKVNPNTKKVEQEIVIPNVNQITSVAFGGLNLNELFVTTARLDGSPEPAGGLFRVTGLGVKGTKIPHAKIKLI